MRGESTPQRRHGPSPSPSRGGSGWGWGSPPTEEPHSHPNQESPLRSAASLTANDAEDVFPIAGFPVLRTTAAGVSRRIGQAMARGEQTVLFFANANLIVQCAHLRERMQHPGVLIANDGLALDIGAWLIHRQRFPENLNGTDFVPRLLAEARRPVFLFGAQPGIAQRAAQHLRNAYSLPVAGTCDGFRGCADRERLIEAINASGAQIVLVAMGNPLQEEWILDNRDRLDARLLIGVGALFDFLAGDKPRAPRLVQRLRLEWLFRLALEPRRLMKRYTVDIVRFLALCLARGKG